jgi:hypothetical protein
MTQEHAKDVVTRMLASYRLYMVMTHQSRSLGTRHYRLIAANGKHVDDVTALVCRSINQRWDVERGTYNARGSMRSQDSSELAYSLRAHCDIRADVALL